MDVMNVEIRNKEPKYRVILCVCFFVFAFLFLVFQLECLYAFYLSDSIGGDMALLSLYMVSLVFILPIIIISSIAEVIISVKKGVFFPELIGLALMIIIEVVSVFTSLYPIIK